MVDLEEILPPDFHPSSRIWMYQSSRLLLLSEVFETEKILTTFTENWQSHGVPVKGFATVLYGQFILLMADETSSGVSGCSTDSSVRVMKQLEQQFNIQLFDRQSLAFLMNGKVQLLPLSQLGVALANGFITMDTLYFNNTVQTKAQLLQNWLIPVQQSWLAAKAAKSAAT